MLSKHRLAVVPVVIGKASMHSKLWTSASWAMQAPEKRYSDASEEPSKQKLSGGGSGSKRRGRPPQQGGGKDGKAPPKPPKPAVKSPIAKGQKLSGQNKAKEAGQIQAASTKSSGTASSFRHRHDNLWDILVG